MSASPIDPGLIRAGDAERQAVADRLAKAHALGQIDVDEFHDRVGQAHSARIRAELEPLTADLPDDQPERKAWIAAGAGDRAKAARSMLASVPRKVWIIAAAIISSIVFAGAFFGDGGERDHYEGPRGGHGMGHPGDMMGEAHEHAYGFGFLNGVASVIGLLLAAALVFFVVRRVKRRKAASRSV